MASCEAHDVQLKAFSPEFLRTREARADPKRDALCAAEQDGKTRCPEGFCRCSGVLRPKVETPERPWGVRETEKKPCAPFKNDFDEQGAKDRRAALKDGLVTKLREAIAAARAQPGALGADEEERVRELEEWLEVLTRAAPAVP